MELPDVYVYNMSILQYFITKPFLIFWKLHYLQLDY